VTHTTSTVYAAAVSPNNDSRITSTDGATYEKRRTSFGAGEGQQTGQQKLQAHEHTHSIFITYAQANETGFTNSEYRPMHQHRLLRTCVNDRPLMACFAYYRRRYLVRRRRCSDEFVILYVCVGVCLCVYVCVWVDCRHNVEPLPLPIFIQTT